MKTKLWAIIVMVVCSFITALGTFTLKKAAFNLDYSFGIFFNHWIYISACLYVLGAVLMLIALKGGELSILYPVLATTFIWITIFSVLFLEETITLFQGIGIGLIVVGVAVLGSSSSNKEVRSNGN